MFTASKEKDGFLSRRIEERRNQHALRVLSLSDPGLTDFCSNDYLGMVHNGLLLSSSEAILRHGSTGARSLTGQYKLMLQAEDLIADFHEVEAALLFNSGYVANLGLISAVAGRGDTVIYDQLIHASIRDGIRLSRAESFSFPHNQTAELEKKILHAKEMGQVFVVTESVFSMDGDIAPLEELAAITARTDAHLIVDEAHATGIYGEKGEGLVQQLGLASRCFARVYTFGKAMGCHGAVVLGTATLKTFLVNFSRPFTYTTSLPETSVAAIIRAYRKVPELSAERGRLQDLISRFIKAGIPKRMEKAVTAIQPILIEGNTRVRAASEQLKQAGIDIRPVLYPSVPKGQERLRVVLHSYNTDPEMDQLLHSLPKLIY
jgi:8-amino-7-oxononanoate synthase